MNIVFDIGNVLLHWDPRVLYRKIFASEDEVDWFLGNVCTSEWNLEQDRGRSWADADGLYAGLRDEEGRASAAAYVARLRAKG